MKAAAKPQVSFSLRDLVGIKDLEMAEISAILDLADRYAMQYPAHMPLKGCVLINLFLENSTRTRLSFEIAAKRLGAEVINMSTDGSSVKKGESFTDTLKTLNAMRPDFLVIRHNIDGAARDAADIFDCPVINGGDGTNEHPTQALLDALTLRRHFGRLEELNVTICGDIKHSRVAHSNGLLLKKMGARVTWAGPKELLPPGLENATTDFDAALKNADAVMMLRIQKERLEKNLSLTEEEYFRAYGLTAEKLALAKPHAVVLHPGPMNRGIEIDSAVADDPQRSLILKQVELGVAVRMACLELLSIFSKKIM